MTQLQRPAAVEQKSTLPNGSPHIMSERINFIITRIATVAGFSSVLSLSCLTAPSLALAQRGPAVVEVEPATLQNVASTQLTVGTVMPTRRAVIGSAVDGRVTKFLVREGQRVEKDQPLAELLTETIKMELAAAEGDLRLKQQELLELENGSRVEELAQAKARLEAIRVAADYFGKERDRLVKLGSSSAVSASEKAVAVFKALEAEQRFQESQAAYELALEGPRPERIAQARAEVDIREAMVKKLSDQIAKHTMYSRFSGYVTVEHTEVGQWLPRGDLVAEIVALDEVDVVAKVLEAHIPFISVGDSVDVEIPALPNESFTGKVSAIVPQADVRSRTFPVKIRVTNRIQADGEPLLKAGMLARVNLPIEEPQNVLLASKDALVLNGQQTIVWTIAAGTVKPGDNNALTAAAVPVPITTGLEQGGMIELKGDIAAGTLIVVKGNERIQPGRPGGPAPQVTWQAAKQPAAEGDTSSSNASANTSSANTSSANTASPVNVK